MRKREDVERKSWNGFTRELSVALACMQEPDGGEGVGVVHVDPACMEEALGGVTWNMPFFYWA